MKPVLVITHERSGTHLLINIINYDKNGAFSTIGYIPEHIDYNIKNYKYYTQKDIFVNSFRNEFIVYKSHHQVQFMIDYFDILFEKYHVIYLHRDLKDVLVSYYRFLKKDKIGFPDFADWIFMNPNEIGRKYIAPYPDPHVIIEPIDYIDRWRIHLKWLEYSDKMLVLKYEDILTDFSNIKYRLENYIGKKVSEKIPDITDKNLPNFLPGKGIIGSHKDFMDEDLISKINQLSI